MPAVIEMIQYDSLCLSYRSSRREETLGVMGNADVHDMIPFKRRLHIGREHRHLAVPVLQKSRPGILQERTNFLAFPSCRQNDDAKRGRYRSSTVCFLTVYIWIFTISKASNFKNVYRLYVQRYI